MQISNSPDDPRDMYFKFVLADGRICDYNIHDNEDRYLLIKK